MIYALNGTIVHLGTDHVIIDVGGIEYRVLVSRINVFTLGKKTRILTEQIFREDDQYLVGFSSEEERFLFERFLSVKGIGPKTALSALSGAMIDDIVRAITLGNVSFLKSLPGIGPKAASQIILDLRGKLIDEPTHSHKTPLFQEAKEALQSLGFKSKEIDDALKRIKPEETSVENVIKLALKSLGK
jgi:Holliday junction DNA helicase RuvA